MTVGLRDIARDPWAHIAEAASIQAESEVSWRQVRAVVEATLGDEYAAWFAAVVATMEPEEDLAARNERVMQRGDNVEIAEWIHRKLNAHGAPSVADLGAIWAYEDGLWVEYDEPRLIVEIGDMAGTHVHGGFDKDGEEKPPRALKVNAPGGALAFLRALPSKWGQGRGFFDDAPRGVAIGGTFLEASLEGGVVVERELAAHHKARARFDFEWDPGAECPRFRAYLADIWRGEEDAAEREQLLAEFAGAALFGLSTRYHKALALQGAPGSGKSTFISLLESIFPDGTVSHVGPSTWDDDDKLGMLITAKLNTVSEASKGAILAQDRLKSVLGGEGQTVVRKWEKAATFYPRTAHLFAFNTWPTVPGADASFWDRWACLTLRHRVRETGEEVKGLAAEIARDERPGLVAWAVEGARSLLEKDGYTIPPSSAAALAEWQQHADSLGMWLASEVENINVGGKHWTPARTAFKAFCEWAAEGRYRAMNETTFGTRLVERGITKKKISSMRYAFTLRSEGPI